MGLRGRLLAMASLDDVVADGADLRSLRSRLRFLAPELRRGARRQQTLYRHCPPCRLLGRHPVHLSWHGGLGKAQYAGRHVRNHRPRSHPDRARGGVCRHGQANSDAARCRVHSRPDQTRQPGPRGEHLPVLRRHGNASRPCEAFEESVARLPAVDPDRDRHDGCHFRVGDVGRSRSHPGEANRPRAKPAQRLSGSMGFDRSAMARQCHGRDGGSRRAGSSQRRRRRPLHWLARRRQGWVFAASAATHQRARHPS